MHLDRVHGSLLEASQPQAGCGTAASQLLEPSRGSLYCCRSVTCHALCAAPSLHVGHNRPTDLQHLVLEDSTP